jgi:hypothetical protein
LRIQISEDLERPLGKGFDNVPDFLKEYIRPERDEKQSTPDLGFSLGHFSKIEGIDQIIAPNLDNPLCLIEGCTCPTNGKALKNWLESHGAKKPQVDAIDLIDVGKIFEKFGIEMPDTSFFVADATNLRKNYKNSQLNFVVQDFLLNCAPHSTYNGIMNEVSRILKPEGLGLICFTDNKCIEHHEKITWDDVRSMSLRPNKDAFCIRDLLDGRVSYEKAVSLIAGKTIVDNDQHTFITKTGGNFEFFRPHNSFEKLFDDCGLKIVGEEESSGIDRNGITCVRYRTVLRKK